MPTLRLFLIPLLIALCSISAVCRSADAAEPITLGERSSIESKVLGEQRQLMIAFPRGYKGSTASYPVIYLLDPGNRFHHTAATVSELARIGRIPEMIVVGVVNTDRNRDLTPLWARAEIEEDMQAMVQGSGGADRFLEFMADELIPHVEATYRTAPFSILIGHSFGGLLGVHALTTHPELFQGILAISPSLWWDGGAVVERASELLRSTPGLRNRLFVTLGDEGGDMLAQVQAFENALRYLAPGGLSWEVRYLGTESHGTVPIPSVHYGLLAFFPRWQVPPFLMEQGLAGIDRHYSALSADMGYPIASPEPLLNRLGYGALGAGEIDRAIAIFTANVGRYPGSANVYDSLGEAYEAAGNLEKARDLYHKAHDIGRQNDDPATVAFQQHLETVTEKLAAR